MKYVGTVVSEALLICILPLAWGRDIAPPKTIRSTTSTGFSSQAWSFSSLKDAAPVGSER